MKEEIKVKRLSEEFVNLFRPVFKDKIIDVCLENNAWIAGGFARKIAHMYFNVCKDKGNPTLPYQRIVNYFRYGGDIDIFTSSKENLKQIENIIFISNSDANLKKEFNKSCYSSPFALNFLPDHDYHFNRFYNNEAKAKIFHNIQIVNKFFFKDVKECFESFDFNNCKYAIKKIGNEYVLYYSSLALEDDIEEKINICHTNSPFLGNRIYKYCNKHGLKVADNKNNAVMLKEFCLKLLTKSWDKKFKFYSEETFITFSAKNIHKAKQLSLENLSLFIGRINHNINIMVPQGYGYYISNEIVDWASHEIRNLNKSDTCKKF